MQLSSLNRGHFGIVEIWHPSTLRTVKATTDCSRSFRIIFQCCIHQCAVNCHFNQGWRSLFWSMRCITDYINCILHGYDNLPLHYLCGRNSYALTQDKLDTIPSNDASLIQQAVYGLWYHCTLYILCNPYKSFLSSFLINPRHLPSNCMGYPLTKNVIVPMTKIDCKMSSPNYESQLSPGFNTATKTCVYSK